LDAHIFADWAGRWAGPDSTPTLAEDDQCALDIALKGASAEPLRSLDSRIQGAKRLLMYQAFAALVQFVLLLLALGLHLLGF
jgi:hypothetical protein